MSANQNEKPKRLNPLDRIIVDAAFASLLRNRARLLVPVCSGRIHDPGASTVADINAMYTEAENVGSHQHAPRQVYGCAGGQGRMAEEIAEYGRCWIAVGKWALIAGSLLALALLAVGVL